MIKGHVSRAIQISCLTVDQVERLHKRENERGHLIANYNIQEIFKLSPLKDIYGVPFDDESQIKHHTRIEKEMFDQKMFITEEKYENSLDWVHSFDFNVVHNKGAINWSYVGGRMRSNLSSQLEGN